MNFNPFLPKHSTRRPQPLCNRPRPLLGNIRSLLTMAVMASSASAAVTYVGDAIIPGNGTDQSGLNGTILEDGVSPNNALNGFGSGLAYAGGNLFYGLADRGPNKVAYSGGTAVDNTTNYPNRYQQFSINLTPVGSLDGNGHYASYTVNTSNVGTTLLTNTAGSQYLGISTAYNTNLRLDSEGIRVAPDGTVWVSDEYGPFLLHFNRQGKQIGSLALPTGFLIANPAATLTAETANNNLGRVTNRGMEGLAISPDGKTLVGIMQSPLIQDGGSNGTNVRILVYDLTKPSTAPRQYLYQLDSTSTSNSEILAVNSHKFLVDERNGTAGAAGIKKLYQFDLNQVTSPTDLTTSAYPGTTVNNGLPTTGTPAGVVPLQKTLFADIGQILRSATPSPFSTVSGTDGLPDKIEGYAWGPDLADGRHLLLATNDNDFVQPGGAAGAGFPNYIFAFAVDASDVPDFQLENFDPYTALNSIDHIVVIYQENWSFDGLYSSFPGANGIASASANSLNQLDRLTGNALSSELGTNTFNRLSQTGNTQNSSLVLSGSNTNSNPGTLNDPPQPLGSLTGSSVVDTRFSMNPADPTSSLTINSLAPYILPPSVNPIDLTGDIVHRYWHEQFQILGAQTNNVDHGDNSGFITWSDNPGLVMSRFDATNLPEGLLGQQYTMCDNFFHSAFGGSFLNHQFFVSAAPPAYDNMPASNNGNIAYLDSTGLLVINTSGPSQGKQVQDGNITSIGGETLTVTLNGSAGTAVTANGIAFADGSTFARHYAVNTIRSKNLTGNNENPTAVSTLPSLNDSNPSDNTRTYTPTIGDLLSAANVSWKWYSGAWNQIMGYSGSNPSPITSPSYSVANASLQMQYHHQAFAYYDNYAPFDTANLVPVAYVGGFAGVGTGGLTAGQANITRAQNSAAHLQDETNFFTDVAANTLPSVVFIKPVGINNEHPGYAALQTGQAHVASIVQALQSNPTLWAHTAVIVTYDEHGGRWDHVTPPVRDIWGPGVRVPALVFSPLARKGYVDHISRDTSSILTTIEQRFNLPSLNQRDATAASFAEVFTAADIARSGFALNRRLGQFTQVVTVTNRSSQTLGGPLQLVLDSPSTTLVNSAGTTTNNAPLGSPFVTVSAGSLAPGASASVTLQFTPPASGGITYSARTVAGTSNP